MAIKPPPQGAGLPDVIARWLYDVYTTLKSGFDFSGLTATVTELNNVDGTTSNVQTQLDTKLTSTNNFSDVPDKSLARNTLGLGSMATQNSPAVSITGGSVVGATITGSSIDGTTVGATSTSSGAFTTLSSSSTLSANAGINCTGDLSLQTAGNRISVPTGTNATAGSAVLVAGTVVVSTTAVTASSLIFMNVSTKGGTQGTLSYTISAGTSFTISSTNAADTSTVVWLIIN